MTEITRVPLQPIKKGSLVRLWLAVAVAVLLASGLAYASVPKGLNVETLVEGTGDSPQMGDFAFVKYVGLLPDGTEFDRSQPNPFPPGVFPDGTPFPLEEGAMIPGFLNGLMQTREGGKYRIEIPSDQAYGADPQPGSPIPPNSDLIFEVEVIEFMPRQEVEARVRQMQAMMGASPGSPEPRQPSPRPAPPSQ